VPAGGPRIPPTAAARDAAAEVQERFERLLAVGIAITSEHTLDEVLKRVVDSARAVVGARYAALGVRAEDGPSLQAFYTSGLAPGDAERMGPPPSGHGLLGVLIRAARPIRVPDIARHPQSSGFPPGHPPMTSFLGVPILARGRVFGDLYLTDKVGAAEFSAEDERMAVLLATQAAAAIENARLFEESSSLLERVRTMQRQRDQFFAMINHELRNALTGVFGWAEQLVRAKTPGTSERATREVYEAAERTITLMNNLLDLSRLDASKVQAVFRDTRIETVVARAVATVQPAADAKPVLLRVELPEPAPLVRTDGLRLGQIVHNLLTNAVRHSRPEETVRVVVEETTDELSIHVIDRGPGIPLEDQQRIFEPFIRHDPDSGLGSGLGLPVSRRLAELLGGRLTLSSAMGRGATFSVSLPRTPPTG
jgi:signal transduction histidine kinase